MAGSTPSPPPPTVSPEPMSGLTPSTAPQLKFNERYRWVTELGEGGMGQVRLFKDDAIGRRVAVKVLRSNKRDDAGAYARLVREAQVQGQLEHPAIVPVYDIGLDEKQGVYFTMKRVRGLTLAEVLVRLQAGVAETSEQFSRRRLLTSFRQVVQAVDFAHTHGVLHRDLKPSNIMFGDFGEVYVVDWGLAKLVGDADSSDPGDIELAHEEFAVTLDGALMGTVGYMPPEQLRGRSAGPASDIYALGAILFEALTLETLVPRERLHDALFGDNFEARASTRRPDLGIAPELDAICVRATAADPDQRFKSARELGQALDRYLDGVRDQTLRKTVAEQHVVKAEEAASEALDAGESALDQRRAAVREIGRALALDPANNEAMTTLVRLLTDPPRQLPEEVKSELARSARDQWGWVARHAAVAYLGLLLYVPILVAVGVRDWTSVILFYALALAASGTAALTFRSFDHRSGWVLATMVISNAAFASTTLFVGPFILPPLLVTINTAPIVLTLHQRLRPLAVACGLFFALLPMGVELALGLPSIEFVAEGMLMHPAAVELTMAGTFAFVSLATVGAVTNVSLALHRSRKVFDAAETQLYLQNWHLRQLLADAAPAASSPSIWPHGA